MLEIFRKEIRSFFSSLIGYIVIGVFLLVLGLVLFVFTDSSLLDKPYASLEPLFTMAPIVFLFLIPAVTMRSFAEENQNGTIELLLTKPLSEWDIVLGKYFASLCLVLIALLPTVLYFFTMYELGSPRGNIDTGAVLGSYFGLFMLATGFTAIGLFASSLSNNQIVSFLAGTFISFFFYYAFFLISRMPIVTGTFDDLIQRFGMDYHYASLSRGVIDTRDVVYFITLALVFLRLTLLFIQKRKW
jgi:ABC-2 type transport system permease protein